MYTYTSIHMIAAIMAVVVIVFLLRHHRLGYIIDSTRLLRLHTNDLLARTLFLASSGKAIQN